jgi:(2Fe-2S) ferredoxin
MNPEKAKRFVEEHLKGGKVVAEYTIGAAQAQREVTINDSFTSPDLWRYRLYIFRFYVHPDRV